MDGQASQLDLKCKQCGLPIPDNARLCHHCHSYQDWRGWLSISNTALALIIALITVVSTSVVTLGDYFRVPRSDAFLTSPAIDGTSMRVVAINHGDAPAAILDSNIVSEFLAPSTKIKLRDESNAIIPPGSQLLIFDIIPLLTEDESYRASLEILGLVTANAPIPMTSIHIRLRQSSGDTNSIVLELSGSDIFKLLRSNADRCSALSDADFLNGCVGTGEPAH